MVRTKYSTLRVSELLNENELLEARDNNEAVAELYARMEKVLEEDLNLEVN